jgi:hypothetical protein
MLATLLAACDFSFDLGPALGGGGGWWGDSSSGLIHGIVHIGDLPSLPDEGTVLLYAPSDTTTPVDSVPTGLGSFDVWMPFGDPACESLVRVRLWNGYVSDLQPLLDSAPDGCDVEDAWPAGARFELPGYAPLDEPFTVEGRVFVDGEPAVAGQAGARLELRWTETGVATTGPLETDDDGWYRYETIDKGDKFALCSWVLADVSSGTRRHSASLGRLLPESCVASSGRTLPETRLGATEAVAGQVWIRETWSERPAGAGEVVVELLDPADSSAIARSEILDDGSYHLWFPEDLENPGCDWLLRATHRDGAVQTVPFRESSASCRYGEWRSFVFERTGPDGPDQLVLRIDDPVGDHTGRSDVTRMTMEIDAASGAYRIVIEADSAALFQDSLRINVNLYNTDAGSFFSHTVDDRLVATPAAELVLEGFSSAVRSWRNGDRVYTNSLEGTPNPPGSTLFRSSVTHFPMGFLTNEDVIAFEDLARPAILRQSGS